MTTSPWNPERMGVLTPLDEEEVSALPEGTPVVITWSGGNGPHFYFVEHRKGVTYAVTEHEKAFGYRMWNAIGRVGSHPLTQVWALGREEDDDLN